VDARHFVQFELADRLKEEKFLREISLVGAADEREHKELTVLRCFERIGFYVDKGFIDPDVVYVVASGRVQVAWHALKDVVAVHRSIAGGLIWFNFEQLYKGCLQWMREHDIRVDDWVARMFPHDAKESVR